MEQLESFPASNTLSRFNDTSAKFQRYKILLRRRWWFLLLTAAIAVCFQALRITSKTTEYVTVGKLIVGTKVTLPKEGQSGEIITNMALQEFYGTQIEILESYELKHRALDRVRSLHPELKEIDVEIRVSQTKGSSILNVAAVGEEAKYTRVYLDALLDEYIAFRKDMTDKSINSALNKVITEVLSRDNELKKKSEALQTFIKENDVELFTEGRNQAAQYLHELETKLYAYQTENRIINVLSLEDYLLQKNRAGSSAGAGGEKPAVSSDGTLPSLRGDLQADLPGNGLARSEIDYLKGISDLRVMEAERLQLVKTYKPAHEVVQEIDRKIEKQRDLIEIFKQQSREEWERRKKELKSKIDGLQADIVEWKNKAREANEKIATHVGLKNDFDRADKDLQDWKKTMERLESGAPNEPIAIMERPQAAVESTPDLWIPLLIGVFVGLAVGLVTLLLFDRLDDRMNSFSEFQALFPMESILAQIPEVNNRGDVELLHPNDERHLYAEAFKNLRSSILFKNWKGAKHPKLICVTSAVPNEGKTTTAANLSISLALGGSRVLLVDTDLRRGGVNELFKVPVVPGFSEVLTSKLHWRDAVQETSTSGLRILPRGEVLDQTSELLLSPLTQEVVKEMGGEYDYVIFDSAPVLVADDTACFAPKVDTTFFVVRMSSTMARLSAKALDLLYERQVNIGGVILNRGSTSLKEYTYYNYASYYSTASKKEKAATL